MTAQTDSMVAMLARHAAVLGPREAISMLDRQGRIAATDSYQALDEAARRIAAALRAEGLAGQPVLLAMEPGLDFVRCFLGCLYAGVYAVPVPAVWRRQAEARLLAILEDARPVAMLCSEGMEEAPGLPRRLTPAALLAAAPGGTVAGPAPEAPAFIQYSSGSTGDPKGIVVTHGNIMANQAMIRRAFRHDAETRVVSWLPVHHDMGLIGSILQPLHLGGACLLMSPLSFLQRPARWLRAIAEHRATTSGAPNFAYEMCVRHVTPAEAEGLDLSSWRLAFCGSEPVRPETMRRFAARFAPHGFAAGALYPCYGLAEATLFVAGGMAGSGLATAAFRREGIAELAADAGRMREITGCGHAWEDGACTILDGAGAALPEGSIGEIAVAGSHVTPGLWDAATGGVRPHEGRLLHRAGRSWLRTGDAGCIRDGQLHVVGRLKDIIILRGANIHAEDVERSVIEHPAAGCFAAVAAFAIEIDRQEEIALACELDRGARAPDAATLEALSRHVAKAHGVRPAVLAIARAGALPRTTSGKVQRGRTRAAFLDGRLRMVEPPAAADG